MHYGKKASLERQSDVLDNVLLGVLVSLHSCECYFDTYLNIVLDQLYHF